MSAVAHCCARLAACADLSIALPNSATYSTVQSSFWSLQESSLAPACVVSPTTSYQVSEAIGILTSDEACHNVGFAIKGQGHSPAAGWANINSGITIDMTPLNTVTLNPDNSVAHIGAGATWLDVYTALDPYNVTAAGGRNGAVGVGGLTLGGGISYFSPQVGFTCDTVVNYEIVLANGQIVHASHKSNRELFRALRGGMNNFGVVTKISMRTIPYSGILAGSVANEISERKAVFKAFANIAAAPKYDVHASIVTSLIFNSTSKEWALASTPVYTQPEKQPAVYDELLRVPKISDTLHITNLSTFAAEKPLPPLNWMFYTATFGVSAEFLETVFKIANDTVYDFTLPNGLSWALALEPLPTVFVDQGAGYNSLGTSAIDGNSIILLISPLWPAQTSDKAKHDAQEAVHAHAMFMTAKINQAARDSGLGRDFVYANYANPSQDPVRSYGEVNAKRLEMTAHAVDPHGVFTSRVPGGFKVRR